MNESTATASNPQPLRLRHAGDPILRKKAKLITSITPDLQRLAEQMIVTMIENRGVGLAAPQVGRSIRLITIGTHDPARPLPPDASPGERLLCPRMPLALINPEILSSSPDTDVCDEGCLSVPKIYGPVVRSTRVMLKAMTLDGNTIDIECGGFLARCLQHEIDHLDGILYVERLSPEDRARIEGEFKQLIAATKAEIKANKV